MRFSFGTDTLIYFGPWDPGTMGPLELRVGGACQMTGEFMWEEILSSSSPGPVQGLSQISNERPGPGA